jgi:hypothetical protein
VHRPPGTFLEVGSPFSGFRGTTGSSREPGPRSGRLQEPLRRVVTAIRHRRLFRTAPRVPHFLGDPRSIAGRRRRGGSRRRGPVESRLRPGARRCAGSCANPTIGDMGLGISSVGENSRGLFPAARNLPFALAPAFVCTRSNPRRFPAARDLSPLPPPGPWRRTRRGRAGRRPGRRPRARDTRTYRGPAGCLRPERPPGRPAAPTPIETLTTVRFPLLGSSSVEQGGFYPPLQFLHAAGPENNRAPYPSMRSSGKERPPG